MRKAYAVFLAAATAIALVPVGGARAAPVFDEPIWVGGAFNDNTTFGGVFQLNQYGFTNAASWFLTTGPGRSENDTAIGGFTFSSTSGTTLSIATPPDTYAIYFYDGGYSEELDLTFAHALNIGGPDAILAGVAAYSPGSPNSGECAGYSCSPANERLVASGVAYVPEPASMAVFGTGLAGLAALLRRRPARSGAATSMSV